MLEVKLEGWKTADLPYTVHLFDVTEEMFDEIVDEDTKAELLDEVMMVHSPASLELENIGSFLGGLMRLYAEERSLGLVIASGNAITRLARSRKVAPDVFFIAKPRVPTPLPKQFDGAPDLAVEILSASNREDDLIRKRPAYRQAGVREIWLVDPESKQVILDRRGNDGYEEEIVGEGMAASRVLEGFRINVSWLWSDPLPNLLSCFGEILAQ
jgi:Uma2 family endonuclease